MYTTYRLKVEELDNKFIEGLKVLFKNKEIEIAVYETDETDYLFQSPANRKSIIDAINDIENNKNIVVPDQEQFT